MANSRISPGTSPALSPGLCHLIDALARQIVANYLTAEAAKHRASTARRSNPAQLQAIEAAA